MENSSNINLINKLRSENENLKKENNQLKKRINVPTNRGEQITSQQLKEIMTTLKKDSIISMYSLYDDLVIYDLKCNKNRQIDHLAITNKGMFMVESKYWKGDIYYNFSGDDLKKFNMSGLEKYIYDAENKSYKTFILDSDNDVLHFNTYGHPYIQAMTSATFLQKTLNLPFINPIVYFNYQGDYNVYIGNEDKYVGCVYNKEMLLDFIKSKITSPKNKKNMNETIFNKYCNIIENHIK
ncbi:nuclease-related domain-containing protein [Staphylococcus warneri]|uniref:nuclease-related domain-containing protein n=1 Tax=Staphylococcus warneri TaxID=1292 RepID=UPI0022E75CB8|nr:nuclease-related domain-containing protein [Staphylococcus warneri]